MIDLVTPAAVARNGRPLTPPADAAGRDHFESLLARIRQKAATVGIIGLGYVGLPLARAFTSSGVRALGFDVDPEKVEKLRRGVSYIGHIPGQALADMRDRGFQATGDFGR